MGIAFSVKFCIVSHIKTAGSNTDSHTKGRTHQQQGSLDIATVNKPAQVQTSSFCDMSASRLTLRTPSQLCCCVKTLTNGGLLNVLNVAMYVGKKCLENILIYSGRFLQMKQVCLKHFLALLCVIAAVYKNLILLILNNKCIKYDKFSSF